MSGNVSTESDEFDEVIGSSSDEFDEVIDSSSDEFDEVIDSSSDEFDDDEIYDDDDVSDDDRSEVTRMGRRTVSQARWATESRVAGTMQSSLPTAHLRGEGLMSI